MKAILHTHSIYSDGSDTPERIVELAKESSVDLLALTDHNTFDGYPRFQAACLAQGISYIKGVEIDCVQSEIGFRQELLAYFPNGGEECLAQVLAHKQQARYERVVRALTLLSDHYQIDDLSMAELELMAVQEKGFIGFLSNKLVYHYLLTKRSDLPSYVQIKECPIWKEIWRRTSGDLKYTLYELIPLVREAGGYPVLAHFGFHFGADIELMQQKELEYIDHLSYMKSIGLWGIEMHPYRFHPRRDEINSITRSWAEKVGLQLTTGSDYHGGETSEHRTFDWVGTDFQGFR